MRSALEMQREERMRRLPRSRYCENFSITTDVGIIRAESINKNANDVHVAVPKPVKRPLQVKQEERPQPNGLIGARWSLGLADGNSKRYGVVHHDYLKVSRPMGLRFFSTDPQ